MAVHRRLVGVSRRDSDITEHKSTSLQHFRSHSRNWRDNLYVYPVISRRSRGLSLGVNLNPDAACNFDCIYCQVDRAAPPRVRQVDPQRMGDELRDLVTSAKNETLFTDPQFAGVPANMRSINDIAFSGDGEPTTCPVFGACVDIVVAVKRELHLDTVKLVLITDACYLTKPNVRQALDTMDPHSLEVWAKLDAGTEAYYQRINRPNYPLDHVIRNIVDASQERHVVIQSLFMRVDGEGPSNVEIDAYIDRLGEILHAGGRIDRVQVYTIARKPAQRSVTALDRYEVDAITDKVRQRCDIRAESYYAPD